MENVHDSFITNEEQFITQPQKAYTNLNSDGKQKNKEIIRIDKKLG
jgi:hypothetical protein